MLFSYLMQLKRRDKILVQLASDSVVVVLSFWVALALRFELTQFSELLNDHDKWKAVLVTAVLSIGIFWGLGLYRSLVRFVTGNILVTIAACAVASSIILFLSELFFDIDLPRSIPLIYMVLLVIGLAALRFVVRYVSRMPDRSSQTAAIIYGAGETGIELNNSLVNSREYLPVAFVDDDTRLQGMKIGGCSVHSPTRLPSLVKDMGVKIILLAMPSVSRTRRREIVTNLEQLGIEIRTIPAMADILRGRAKVSELVEIAPDDLLGRDPIAPDESLMEANIAGKVVMVTGAGGSIGSELCRQILSRSPAVLVLFEVSEFALYAIESDLKEHLVTMEQQPRIVPLLGSVQNTKRLETAIREFKVETIFHAAAYKHVPLVEENVVEGIRNNVFGTLTLAQAARKLNVQHFILVSTDKAVRPTNIMGASKRIAELICQAHAQEGNGTVFSMVRFGNVLGSSGSVIPRFRAQIEAGGPVTVTHPEINRYFMTIREASQLVIQAGAMAQGGDVFVLDMGEPVKVVDLAVSMIRLHGLKPYFMAEDADLGQADGDIAIRFTGLRKGEKLYEELLIGENSEGTKHPRIMTAKEVFLPLDELHPVLDRLLAACIAFDLPEIHRILDALPLQYRRNSTEISDLVWRAAHIDQHENARNTA
jgi:FlaA1/EpsC-like NDP-sugar epimerase